MSAETGRADPRPAIDFPDGFMWGAATAAYQIEGAVDVDGRGPSVWDVFSHTPGKVANGDTGDVACDHYHRIAEDIGLMSQLGLGAYRFSISWSRVMPDGRGRINPAGLDFYKELVDRLLAAGIVAIPTLFHWDLPQGLEDIGGFRHRDTARWFADYAAEMVSALGDRVSMWSTFNEPWCFAYLGHASGVHAPGLTDGVAALRVAHHQLLAHGLAIEAMRAERDGLELGIVLNPSPVRSEGSPAVPAEKLDRIDALLNRWWFDGLLAGRYPEVLTERIGDLEGTIQDGDHATIAQALDWIGINYYFDNFFRVATADAGDDDVTAFPTVDGVAAGAIQPTHTDMGWPITPAGFTELLIRLRNDYDNLPPVYITENGAAYDDPVIDGAVDDTRRIDYLDIHLRAIHAAIHAGVDIRGYMQWSLLDNFEWAYGYDKRFGIVHVDFDTLERTVKNSGWWYRDVIAANRLGERA